MKFNMICIQFDRKIINFGLLRFFRFF